jgi:hypothetical protein
MKFILTSPALIEVSSGIPNSGEEMSDWKFVGRGTQMKAKWFREWGWFYMPRAWPGWLLLALTVLFCLQVFTAIDRHSHSASDTLYGIFPFWVSAWTILGWIASRTSNKLAR